MHEDPTITWHSHSTPRPSSGIQTAHCTYKAPTAEAEGCCRVSRTLVSESRYSEHRGQGVKESRSQRVKESRTTAGWRKKFAGCCCSMDRRESSKVHPSFSRGARVRANAKTDRCVCVSHASHATQDSGNERHAGSLQLCRAQRKSDSRLCGL